MSIAVVFALWLFLALVIIGYQIMIDFSKLNTALGHIAASIQSVADAIRNPQVDNTSQGAADEMADRLEAAATTLDGLASEETAMDTADQVIAEPPASEPIAPTELPVAAGAPTATNEG